jgi:hypothetical protein
MPAIYPKVKRVATIIAKTVRMRNRIFIGSIYRLTAGDTTKKKLIILQRMPPYKCRRALHLA